MGPELKEPGEQSPLVEILSNLKIAVAQIRLYPKDSPQVLKVATQAFQSVTSYLNEFGAMILSRTPRGLLINGRRLPVTGEVADILENATLQLLQEVQIKSLSFRKGLNIDELLTFLHALTRKFWDVKEGKEINKRLREERVIQISVDEVEYVAVGEGDLLIEDAARKLEGTGARVAELVRTLDSVIEAAMEEGIAEQVRLQIMKKLLDQDPTLLVKAKAAGLPGTGTGDAPGWITFEQARQSLGEIARQMQTAQGPIRETLKKLGQVIVGGFRHDPTLCALIKKFLTDEAADLMPGWMKGAVEKDAKSAAAVTRTNTILTLEEDQQVEALAKEAGTLAKELVALNRGDMVEELLTVVTGFARDRIAERRLAACDALSGMRLTLEAEAPENLRELFEKRIRGAILSERDPRVYGKLAEITSSLIDARIKKDQYDKAIELLEVLKKQYQVKEATFPQRVEMAYRALERVASGAGFPMLIEKLRTGDPAAMKIIEALDAASTRFLIAEIKGIDNAVQRLRLAEVIARAGSSAAAVFVEEIQKESSPVSAMRLVDILPHAVPDNMAEMALRGLLRHPALAVRRRSSVVLTERAYGRSGMMLMDALRDESDPITRASFIEGLGKLKYDAAAEILCDAVDKGSEPDEVRSAGCIALGRIGNDIAVPSLARICAKGARGITKILNPASAGVRVSAARALASFATDPKAREALKAALEDSDPTVRTAASDALYAPLQKAFGELVREVQMVSAVQGVKSENWKLAGSLGEIPLDQISQLIGTSRKTGLLMVNYNGPTARIFFEEGMVVAAEFESLHDQAAFNAFIKLRDGHFLFQPGEQAPARRFRLPVNQILLEAARRADEGARPGG